MTTRYSNSPRNMSCIECNFVSVVIGCKLPLSINDFEWRYDTNLIVNKKTKLHFASQFQIPLKGRIQFLVRRWNFQNQLLVYSSSNLYVSLWMHLWLIWLFHHLLMDEKNSYIIARPVYMTIDVPLSLHFYLPIDDKFLFVLDIADYIVVMVS